MNKDNHHCHQRMDYFLKEMTELELQAFDRHLASCPSCKEELKELREAWQALPSAMEELEPPGEWKQEILGAILEPKAVKAFTVVKPKWGWPRRLSLAASVLAFVLLGSAGWWGAAHFKPKPEAVPYDYTNGPTLVVGQYKLKSFDSSSPNASGQVLLTQKGQHMELVLQASGLPVQQGEQAYQVWMVKSGSRMNCGTFRVDPAGNGVLTYPFDEEHRDFDTIGITLEPDAGGTAPRGKKMLGT